jgi:hypothetical protein
MHYSTHLAKDGDMNILRLECTLIGVVSTLNIFLCNMVMVLLKHGHQQNDYIQMIECMIEQETKTMVDVFIICFSMIIGQWENVIN